jgi:membrane protease YdiL (CAAX protease family)
MEREPITMDPASVPLSSQDPTVPFEDATPGRTLLAGITLLGVSALGALVIIQGFEFLQTALGVESFALTFLVGGGLATLWLGIFGLAYLRFRPVRIYYGIRWPTLRDAGWIVGGVVLSVILALLVEIVVIPFGDGGATTISSAASISNPLLIYSIFLIGNLVFIAPIEEFLYRGVIQGRLRESFGPVAAISTTSIGFALGHIPSYWFGGSDIVSVSVGGALLGIAAGGLVLGAIYEWTESLLIVTLIHGLLNSIGIGIALLALL